MMHDPSTQLHGVVDAHVELPAWGTMSEDISIKVSGEVDVNSTEMRVNLSSPSFMNALLNLHEFPLPEKLPLKLHHAIEGRLALTLSRSMGW